MTFDLFEGPSGAHVGTATSDELRRGVEVTIPERDGARVLLIQPAKPGPDRTAKLVYDGTTRARVGEAAVLSATLTGAGGPIAGAPVTFAYRGRTFEATTDANGHAVAGKSKQLGPPGIYEVVVTFPGSALLDPARTTATLEIVTASG
jgi:hypothetical protein